MVNPDRTVSVWGDPSVGPYDGGDDTLVGVRNDSVQGVDAITVTGPGTGLGNLDGDGLCTFGVTGCPFGSTGYEGPGTSIITSSAFPDSAEVDFTGSLAPSGTAYFSLEGALTAASLTSRQGHIGNVIQNYVALGDSYSSGEGAAAPPVTSASDASFLPGTDTPDNQCHRSLNAYPEVLKTNLGVADSSFDFHACSGALLSEMTNQLNKDNTNTHKKKYAGQWGEPAQLDHLAPATGPPNTNIDLVTLSIGGNDAGFVDALSNCIHGPGHGKNAHCTPGFMQSQVNRALGVLKNGLRETVWSGGTWDPCVGCPLGARHYGPRGVFVHDDGYVVDVPSLHSLIQQIHDRAPNAKVRFLLYPKFFPAQPPSKCIVGEFHARAVTHTYAIDQDAMTAFNSMADQLDATLMNEVTLAQQDGVDAKWIDPRRALTGHGVACIGDPQHSTSDPWINGLVIDGSFLPTASPSPYSFHPNAKGQQAFETALAGSI